MTRKCMLTALILLLAVLTGCGGVVKDKVSSGIEESLPEIIGPAKSYQVRTYGPPLRVMKGKIDGVDIVGTDVRLPSGVTVSRLDVKIRDLVVDPDTKEIKSVGSTEYVATLSEAELNRYLKQQYPDVPELNIKLKDKVIGVYAKPGLSVLKVGVQADVGLLVRRQTQIALDLKTLKVAGINTPGVAREYIESKIDTIFDAKALGFDARIKSASVSKNGLTLAGNLDLMKAAEKRGQ